MSLKKQIKSKLLMSQSGMFFFYKTRIVREKLALLFYSDVNYIKKVYKKRYHKDINLKSPNTFCEKLQWLKLFYRDSVMTRCSDKYEIHNYLEEIGLDYLGNRILGVYDNAKDIDYEKLPSKFVAKATHGSGWNLICTDKAQLDWKKSVRIMNSWLTLNLFVFGREWNYKEIKPRIIIEEYLDYEPLYDYKFMCFNGIPKYVQLNNDDEHGHHVDFYDVDKWEHLPITYMGFNRSNKDLDKPPHMEKMINLATVLSQRFPFVRVDFYSFDNRVVLGELTFFPSGGLRPFIPEEFMYDELFGELLKLPDPNYNLDLYSKQ